MATPTVVRLPHGPAPPLELRTDAIWVQTIRDLQPAPWTVVTESPYTIATIPSPWCARCFSYHPKAAPHWGRGTTQPTAREDRP